MESRPFTFDRTVRLVIAIAILAALFALTRTLSSVLLPFVVAWFIAYMLHPVVTFVQTKMKVKPRVLAVIVTLILVFGLITGIVALLVPLVKNETAHMSSLVSGYVRGINVDTFLSAASQEWLREQLAQADLQTLLQQIDIKSIVDKAGGYLGSIIGGSLNILSGLFVAFACLLYLIFILIDYETLSRGMHEMIPPKFRNVVNGILYDLEQGMNKYFRGQALIATTVGILFSIGFLIMGLPLAVVVGLFIGLLNMIPYMQAFGIPVTMVLGLLQAADTGTSYWIILLEIAAVFIVVQSIQDFVLNPLIMGNVIGMNPAVMILSLSVWGYLLGVAGMIIALPITTVIISYYKRYVLGMTDNNRQTQTPPNQPADE
ncbi:MAG: AI-2E family transporter [Paludibacteraceae bacterium]|nr:AI-2E family transporter [Paludibacteraceae bacterium]